MVSLILASSVSNVLHATEKSIWTEYDNGAAIIKLDESMKRIRGIFNPLATDVVEIVRCESKSVLTGIREEVPCVANNDGTTSVQISVPGIYEVTFVTDTGEYTYIDSFTNENKVYEIWPKRYSINVYVGHKVDSEIREVAERYSPITLFHRDEEYFPKDIDSVINYGTNNSVDTFKFKHFNSYKEIVASDLRDFLTYNQGTETDFDLSQLGFSQQDCDNNYYGLCIPFFLRELAFGGQEYTIYWQPEIYGSDLYITYHYIYPMDAKGGDAKDPDLASHVFDRESTTIKFNKIGSNYIPESIVYAGHQSKQTMRLIGIGSETDSNLAEWEGGKILLPWSSAQKAGNHPIVHIAKGSHAVFPLHGNYKVINPAILLYASLDEEAGSTVNNNFTTPATHSDSGVKLKELNLSDIVPLRFSGNWVNHNGGTSKARFPPFVEGRYPIDEWFSSSSSLLEVCSNSSDSNGCYEIEKALDEMAGMAGYLGMLVDISGDVDIQTPFLKVKGYVDREDTEVELEQVSIASNSTTSLVVKNDYDEYRIYLDETLCGTHRLLPFQVSSNTFVQTGLDCNPNNSSISSCKSNGNSVDSNEDVTEPGCDVLSGSIDRDNDGLQDSNDANDTDPCIPSVSNDVCRFQGSATSITYSPIPAVVGQDVTLTVNGNRLPDNTVLELEDNGYCNHTGTRSPERQQFICRSIKSDSDNLEVLVGWGDEEQLHSSPFSIQVRRLSQDPNAGFTDGSIQSADFMAFVDNTNRILLASECSQLSGQKAPQLEYENGVLTTPLDEMRGWPDILMAMDNLGLNGTLLFDSVLACKELSSLVFEQISASVINQIPRRNFDQLVDLVDSEGTRLRYDRRDFQSVTLPQQNSNYIGRFKLFQNLTGTGSTTNPVRTETRYDIIFSNRETELEAERYRNWHPTDVSSGFIYQDNILRDDMCKLDAYDFSGYGQDSDPPIYGRAITFRDLSNTSDESEIRLLNAGNELALSSPDGIWETFHPWYISGDTEPYYAHEEFDFTIDGDVPTNLKLTISGNEFPAFSDVPIPNVGRLQNISHRIDDTVSLGETLSWDVSPEPNDLVEIRIKTTFANQYAACVLIDDGEVSLEKLRNILGFSAYSVELIKAQRFARALVQSDGALLTTINRSIPVEN